MISINLFFILIALLWGLSWGSFLNVVIARVPAGESIVSPPSRCPKCGYQLKFYDNIPVISYLILRAKCRGCKAPISMRYPIIELLGGIVSLALFHQFELSIDFIFYFLFLMGLLALTFIDLEQWVVPDIIVIFLAATGLIIQGIAYFTDYTMMITLKESVIGGVVGFGIIALLIVLYKVIRGIDALGWGDANVMGVLGIFLGPEGALYALFMGVLVASVIGIGLIIFNKSQKVPYDDVADDDPIKDKAALPFVPFLVLGGYAYLFFGEQLITLYLSFMKI